MRIFEMILLGGSLLASGMFIFGRRHRWLDIATVIMLLVLCSLHAGLEGLRIQMAPAYGLDVALLIAGLIRIVHPKVVIKRHLYRTKCTLLTVLVLAVSTLAVYVSNLLPVFTMPQPTGSYAIGTTVRHLIDDSREETLTPETGDKRELMVNVWYPVDLEATIGLQTETYPPELGKAISLVFGLPQMLFSQTSLIHTHVVSDVAISKTQAQYPVVLFSPGIRSTRFQSMTAIEELVSRGYIVVGIDHPYTSAEVLFPDGRVAKYQPDPTNVTSAELYAYNVVGVGIRAADASFVLDTLTEWQKQDLHGLLTGKMDMNRVGIFGHSYGGATTAEALATDSRFKAGLSLEGGFWGKVAHTDLQQPFMYLITGKTALSLDPTVTEKDDVFYKEFAGDLERVMTSSESDTYYAKIAPFFHQSFTDLALIAPALFAKEIDPVRNIEITRSYTAAFFDQYLKGEAQSILKSTSTVYPEVKFDQKYTRIRD